MLKLPPLKFSIAALSLTLFLGSSLGNVLAQGTTEQNKNSEYSFACYRSPETGLPTTFMICDGETQAVGIQIIQWQSDGFGEYSPEARCKIVSERMQRLRSSLGFITSSWLNGVPVICVADDMSSRESRCTNSRLLFTLGREDDADKVLKDFEAILTGSAISSITRGVPPSQGGRFYVDMSKLVKFGKAVKMDERL